MLQRLQGLSKHQRERLFFTILPILIFSSITVIGYVFGLIGDTAGKDGMAKGGLNATLPAASAARDSSWNKMQYYEKADKDSAAYYSQQKSDPYLNLIRLKDSDAADSGNLMHDLGKKPAEVYDDQGDQDPNEVKVYTKLQALQKLMDRQGTASTNSNDIENENEVNTRLEHKATLDQLAGNMKSINDSGAMEGDTELHQLNGMLEKILDIQHPERVSERMQANTDTQKQQVYEVTANMGEAVISALVPEGAATLAGNTVPVQVTQNGFYALAEEEDNHDEKSNAIRAIIPVLQTLVSGSTIQLQLATGIVINGISIPRGQLVYGEATLSNERLKVAIHSIRCRDNILPVDLSVYDLDGLEGIYMPGAIGRDVAKQSGDEAIQSVNVGSLDPSIGAQAASAGIQAAKSLIGKKAKLVRMSVRAGYEVLLKDNKIKNQ